MTALLAALLLAPKDPVYDLRVGDIAHYRFELTQGDSGPAVRDVEVRVAKVERGDATLSLRIWGKGRTRDETLVIHRDGTLAKPSSSYVAELLLIPPASAMRKEPKLVAWEAVEETEGVRRVTMTRRFEDPVSAGTLTRTMRLPARGLPLASSVTIERAGKVSRRSALVAVPPEK